MANATRLGKFVKLELADETTGVGTGLFSWVSLDMIGFMERVTESMADATILYRKSDGAAFREVVQDIDEILGAA